MDDSVDFFGIEFVEVPDGEVFVGSDKGGLVHASERPRYEAKIESFKIMKSLLTKRQFSQIMGEENESDEPIDSISWDRLEEMLERIQSTLDDGFEVRLPSEAEWLRCKDYLDLKLPISCEEILWDHPHPNNRGAPNDGRPRIDDRADNLMRKYRVSMKSHPTKSGLTFKTQTPVFSPQKDAHFRLIIRRIPTEEAHSIPEEADFAATFRQEAIFALFIGIIPSFLIPIARGFSDYIYEGWVNLMFGGICFSLVTSLFWRPRRPTWYFDENTNRFVPRKSGDNNH